MTRLNFLNILILLLLSSCSNDKNIYGIWISTSEHFIMDVQSNKIIRKDLYPYTSTNEILEIDSIKTTIWNKKLLIHNKETLGTDTCNYILIDNNLQLSATDYNGSFISLGTYNQKYRQDELEMMLKNNLFEFDDKVQIEFLEDNILFAPNMKHLNERPGIWLLDYYQNELFLINTYFPNKFFHVKQILNNEITVISYKSHRKELKLKRIEKKPRFNPELLIGSWEHDLTLIKEDYKEFEQETLTIDSTTIKLESFENKKVSSAKWNLNKTGEYLLFSNITENDKNSHWRYKSWNISNLSDSVLIINRTDKIVPPFDYNKRMYKKDKTMTNKW